MTESTDAPEGNRPTPGRGILDAVDRAFSGHGAPTGVRREDVPPPVPKPGAGIPSLIPVAVTRGWPVAQRKALQALTELAAEWRIPEEDLDELLDGIAAMDPPPSESERAGFAALAGAIGIGRVAGRLHGSRRTRAGAARVLLAEGGQFAVHLVATLAADPDPGVRRLAGIASRMTGLPPSSSIRAEAPRGTHPSGTAPTIAGAVTDPGPSATVSEVVAAPAGLEEFVDTAVPAANDAWTPSAEAERSITSAAAVSRANPQSLLDGASAPGGQDRDVSERVLAALALPGDRLVGLASRVDPMHRSEAVRVIHRIGGRSVLPFLVDLASDSAGAVRSAVVEVVAGSGDPGGVELARRSLRDDSSAAVRAAAVRALAASGGPGALEGLAEAFSDPDPGVRALAVETLPSDHLGATGLFVRALGDDDPGVWQAGLRRLAGLGERGLPLVWTAIVDSPAERRDEFIRAIERGGSDAVVALALEHAPARDPVERAVAIDLAARAGTPRCTALVIEALQDPASTVRETAARGLADMRTPRAVPALAARLADPQVGVRIEALRALAVTDDEGVPPALISALKDPDPLMREMASDAIMTWRSATMSRQLVEALASPSLRRPAAELLERMGPSVVDPLVVVITGDDVEAAGAAAEVLERSVGAGPFVGDLSSPDVADRLRAVTVIGALGDDTAMQALPTVLGDPEVTIRMRSASLLGAIGDRRALPDLERVAETDPVPEVASAARGAIERIERRVPRSEPNDDNGEEAGNGPHLRRV